MAAAQTDRRSAYSYVRESSGEVTVLSALNGEVEARRNLPISAGDEMRTAEPARAEIALADGNVLHVGGGTRLRFVSLYAQQGSDDEVSAIELSEGSVILSVVGPDEDVGPPGGHGRRRASTRTPELAFASTRTAARHSVVVVRAGSVEVKTRSGSYTVRAGNYLLVRGRRGAGNRAGQLLARPVRPLGRGPAGGDLRLAARARRASTSTRTTPATFSPWTATATGSTTRRTPATSGDRRCRVGWSPYSYGSWYYTPIGLSWWSYDPWGWYPYHYGNWFFDIGWNSWCWSPGYVYSPAWVYWGYYVLLLRLVPDRLVRRLLRRQLRRQLPAAVQRRRLWPRQPSPSRSTGVSTRARWTCVAGTSRNVNNLGTRGRLDVVPGTRVVDRLGSNISVSSRPIVLAERGGSTRDALRDYVREAPRTIERTSNPRDSQRLAPFLARERQLPDETVQALRERAVFAQRGRLVGPRRSEMTARSGGGTVVERGRVPLQTDSRGPRASIARRDGAERSAAVWPSAREARASAPSGSRQSNPSTSAAAPARAASRTTPGAVSPRRARRDRARRSTGSERQVERSGLGMARAGRRRRHLRIAERLLPASSPRIAERSPASSPRVDRRAKPGDRVPMFRPRSG